LKRKAAVLEQKKIIGGYDPKSPDALSLAEREEKLKRTQLNSALLQRLLDSQGNLTPEQIKAILAPEAKAGA
jgi:hypothetical protein